MFITLWTTYAEIQSKTSVMWSLKSVGLVYKKKRPMEKTIL